MKSIFKVGSANSLIVKVLFGAAIIAAVCYGCQKSQTVTGLNNSENGEVKLPDQSTEDLKATPSKSEKSSIINTIPSISVDNSEEGRAGNPLDDLSVWNPCAGQCYSCCENISIDWNYSGQTPTQFVIDFSGNGGSSYSYPVATINNGSARHYSWNVPNNQSSYYSNRCKIRVRAYRNSTLLFTGTTGGTFTILGPTNVGVSVPNSGENWRIGTAHSINWGNPGTHPTGYDIYISRNGTSGPWTWIGNIDGNHNSFNWTATGPANTHCRIKVVAYGIYGDCDSSQDISNNNFTIRN